jgi:hypothetical protein
MLKNSLQKMQNRIRSRRSGLLHVCMAFWGFFVLQMEPPSRLSHRKAIRPGD